MRAVEKRKHVALFTGPRQTCFAARDVHSVYGVTPAYFYPIFSLYSRNFTKIIFQLISKQNKLQGFVTRLTVNLGSIISPCLGNEPLELDRTRESSRNGAY